MVLASVVSNPLLPHGPQAARLLCRWDFPGEITEVDRYVLLQGIFPTQGSNSLGSPALAGGFFTTSATWEALTQCCLYIIHYVGIITHTCSKIFSQRNSIRFGDSDLNDLLSQHFAIVAILQSFHLFAHLL